MEQTSPQVSSLPNGTLEVSHRYREVMQTCQEYVVRRFSQLLAETLDRLDDYIMGLAKATDSQSEQQHFCDVMDELVLRKKDIHRIFTGEVTRGFGNFLSGNPQPLRKIEEKRDGNRLSLIDKEEYEISLAYANMLNRANLEYSEQIFALNHRLAAVIGGVKLGETSPSLPGAPAQICDALRTSLESLDFPILLELKVNLINEIDRGLLRQAREVYERYNDHLIKAGILPNITLEDIGYKAPDAPDRKAREPEAKPPGKTEPAEKPPSPTAPPPQEETEAVSPPQEKPARRRESYRPRSASTPPQLRKEAPSQDHSQQDSYQRHSGWSEDASYAGGSEEEYARDEEMFENIRAVLARRHGGRVSYGKGGGPAAAPDAAGTAHNRGGAAPNTGPAKSQTDYTGLIDSLNSLQVSSTPVAQQRFEQLSLDSVKEAFNIQLGKLSEIVKQQDIDQGDADIIDLVGMLFEYILNDQTLPDSVKALLCHLHTPLLKVALLDKKFFSRGNHPARRLLDAMTQAGALCNTDESDEQGIFGKMRSMVDRICREFDANIGMYAIMLDEFNEFIRNHERRSKVQEKRVVETAKGRERLREARQVVSQEIVDRTWNRFLPKPVESLLLGAWANLMVLTFLRHGQDSEEWKRALALVDDVLWSISPKQTDEERQNLRAKMPGIAESIRAGLTMIGDPEVNTNTLLGELAACQSVILNMSQEELKDVIAKRAATETKAPEEVKPKAIWEDVEVRAPNESQHPFLRNADTETLAIVELLNTIKLGAWFEFYDAKREIKFRAKLSWYSPKTSYYIFVNQAGIQVAIKSLRSLTKEMRAGETRIVPQEKQPFMERAMHTIHSILGKPEDSPSDMDPDFAGDA